MKTLAILLLVISCRGSIVTDAVDIAIRAEGAKAETVGDSGRALGSGQMWKVAVDECNRILGKRVYTYEDRRNPEKVREMCGVTLAYHHRRNPKLGTVALAAHWRNPYSPKPAWNIRKLSRIAHQSHKPTQRGITHGNQGQSRRS